MSGAEGTDSYHLGGRYRLVEKLGTGGMSVVWRAYDETLGRSVAVKVLAAGFAGEAGFRQRIRAEALAVARLVHPHITSVYDYGEATLADGATVPFVVMELVHGESVAARVAKVGPLPWRVAVATGAEVAGALATAHAQGVVHRDVTASNVMLTDAGAKVVDFGISALSGQPDATADGTLLGTPAYLAPERLTGGTVSPATDVYALGVLLHRMLTGYLPWSAESTTGVLKAHLYTEPAPLPALPGLPAEVAELSRRCLAKQPEERPSSVEAARCLAAAVGVHAIVPVPMGTSEAATTMLPGRWPGDSPVSRSGGSPRARRRKAAAAAAHRPARGRGRSSQRRPADLLASGRNRVQAAGLAAGLVVAAGVGWVLIDPPGPKSGAQAAGPGTGAFGARPDGRYCKVRYQVERDSGTAFAAGVTVTNTTKDALTGWQFEFAFDGDQKISTDAPVGLEQNGMRVVIRQAGGDALPAGGSIRFPVRAQYTKGGSLPSAFALNGRACATEASDAAGRPLGTVPGDTVLLANDTSTAGGTGAGGLTAGAPGAGAGGTVRGPIAGGPGGGGPVGGVPGGTGPDVGVPGGTPPGGANPGSGTPGGGNPGGGNPGSGNPGGGNPGSGNPGSGNPGGGNPGSGNPGGSPGGEETPKEEKPRNDKPKDKGGKPKDKGGKPKDKGGKPKDKGEKPKDKGEKPKDKGDKSKDKGGKPKDKGDEPKDEKPKDKPKPKADRPKGRSAHANNDRPKAHRPKGRSAHANNDRPKADRPNEQAATSRSAEPRAEKSKADRPRESKSERKSEKAEDKGKGDRSGTLAD